MSSNFQVSVHPLSRQHDDCCPPVMALFAQYSGGDTGHQACCVDIKPTH